MFPDLQKAMSKRVSYDIIYWEKSLITDVTILKMALVNFKALLLAQFLL